MIAYHFPPVAASSGFLRTLKFAKYLPGYGVAPMVLTVKPNAYEQVNSKNYQLLDDLDKVEVYRCTAKDGARDFAWRGKYLRMFASPDRWASWIPFGVFKGLQLIKRTKAEVIWVTYPIVSALVIGYWLKKITGLPLICDLRDPIWEEETYQDTRRFKWLKKFEERLLTLADRIVFTSPGTIEKYRGRYPSLIADKSMLITNGFDSDNFPVTTGVPKRNKKKVFLHSGIIPVYERNPENFFKAISNLKEQGVLRADLHEFRLRACGFESLYRQRVTELGISDLVSFPVSISYEDALSEMLNADALMVFQDKTCNWQIPAKVFEYMYAQRPVLGWVDPDSDTAKILEDCNIGDFIAPLDDVIKIEEALSRFISRGDWQSKCKGYKQFDRKVLAKELADLVTALATSN